MISVYHMEDGTRNLTYANYDRGINNLFKKNQTYFEIRSQTIRNDTGYDCADKTTCTHE